MRNMRTIMPIPSAAATNPTSSDWADQRGFTLIEALIAIVILIIGIISLYTMQVGAIHGNTRADSVSHLSNWATDRIEQMISDQTNYDELVQKSVVGAGCDADGDGIDDTNPRRQCGLNNPLVAPGGQEPDYRQLGWNCDQYLNGNNNLWSPSLCFDDTTNGNGLIFVNIAPDMPAPNITTIRVKVVTRDFGGQPVITTTTYFESRPQ